MFTPGLALNPASRLWADEPEHMPPGDLLVFDFDKFAPPGVDAADAWRPTHRPCRRPLDLRWQRRVERLRLSTCGYTGRQGS